MKLYWGNKGNPRSIFFRSSHCPTWVLRKQLFTSKINCCSANPEAAPHWARLQFPTAFVTPLGSGSPLCSLHKLCSWAHVTSFSEFIQKDENLTVVSYSWINHLSAILPHNKRVLSFPGFWCFISGPLLTNGTIYTWVKLEITLGSCFVFSHKSLWVCKVFFSQSGSPLVKVKFRKTI